MALVSRLLFYHQTLRDLKRVINCERGVAGVAKCSYPLRYLASRISLRSHALTPDVVWKTRFDGNGFVKKLGLP